MPCTDIILQLVDLTLELNLTDNTSKDEKMINKKILPACLLLPLMLTGCDDINSFFGGSSSPRHAGYDSGYSSSHSRSKNSQNAVADDSASKAVTKTTSSQSGAEAAAVTTPASSTDKKTVTGTVAAPAVPSLAPTVGQ